MIVEAIAGALVGIGLLGGGIGIGTRFKQVITKEVIKEHFVCPYCKVDVTGLRELDIINHSSCITKSEEDIAREKAAEEKREAERKARAKDEPKYFVDIEQHLRKPGEGYNQFEYAVSTGDWVRYKWLLYRNGDLVDSGFEKTKGLAEQKARHRTTLDKHRYERIEVS